MSETGISAHLDDDAEFDARVRHVSPEYGPTYAEMCIQVGHVRLTSYPRGEQIAKLAEMLGSVSDQLRQVAEAIERGEKGETPRSVRVI